MGSAREAVFDLTPVAVSGERLVDFAPYVAAIDAAGRIAFTAATRDGRTGIFVADGAGIEEVASSGRAGILRFTSHPDFVGDGAICAYAELAGGGTALVLARDGEAIVIAGPSDELAGVGPLGPTAEGGAIGFRGVLRDGSAAVLAHRDGATARVADGSRFTAFHGLPVIDRRGRVVLRGDLHDGRRVIAAGDGSELVELAGTGARVLALGRFPCAAGGVVVIDAQLDDGPAILRIESGEHRVIVGPDAGFASVRGAVIDEGGEIFFYATPPGGALGVYRAPRSPVLAIGDPLLGSRVVELALNPVSIDRARLAIRVRLEDGRQAIVRAEPGSA